MYFVQKPDKNGDYRYIVGMTNGTKIHILAENELTGPFLSNQLMHGAGFIIVKTTDNEQLYLNLRNVCYITHTHISNKSL